jgi:hypothetical protein
MQGIPGIEERMKPENFRPQLPSRKSLKDEKGLHDMSGVLLDPNRSMRIGGDPEVDDKNQIYRTTGDTTYAFMPVAPEADTLIFHQLNQMSKPPRTKSIAYQMAIRLMRARITRIKVAFEYDGGCKFLDLAPEGEPFPKFRYGHTGLKKTGPVTKAKMSDKEIQERRDAALKYTSVLTSINRNEVIIAYRQHGLKTLGSRFPMYAKHVYKGGIHTHYKVVDRAGRDTGQIITLKGHLQ